jgi:uncharacterized protein YgfB (UPF0149 family)
MIICTAIERRLTDYRSNAALMALFLSNNNHMADLNRPEFNSVEQALRDAGALGEAAEIHGDLCGLACVMGADAESPWLNAVMAETHDSGARPLLEKLAALTCRSLEEGDMSFELLLPSDDEPLELRANHLAHWVQGFMHGLSGGGQVARHPVFDTETVRGVIEDFSEITHAMFAADEAESESEAAYMELVEYVRVAVQLVYEELHRLRTGSTASGTH